VAQPHASLVRLLFMVAFLPSGPCVARAGDLWETTYELHAATEVAGEGFRIVESETTEVTTDAYGQLRVVSSGALGSWRNIILDNRFAAGMSSLRYDFRGTGEWKNTSPVGVNLDGAVSARRFHGANSASRSSYIETSGEVAALSPLPHAYPGTWGSVHLVRGVWYDRTSSVYTNAMSHWHGLALETTRDLSTWTTKAGVEHEFVPDSSELGYWGFSGSSFAMWVPSLDWLVSGGVIAAWKDYPAPGTHPDESSATLHARVTRRLNPSWSLETGINGAVLAFSPADDVFPSTHNLELLAEAKWEPGLVSTRFGAGAGMQQSPSSPADEYSERFLQAGCNLISRTSGFSDVSFRAGKRTYRHPSAAYSSDYVFGEFTALVSGARLFGVRAEAFVTFRSEHHEDDTENSRNLFITVDISRTMSTRR